MHVPASSACSPAPWCAAVPSAACGCNPPTPSESFPCSSACHFGTTQKDKVRLCPVAVPFIPAPVTAPYSDTERSAAIYSKFVDAEGVCSALEGAGAQPLGSTFASERERERLLHHHLLILLSLNRQKTSYCRLSVQRCPCPVGWY